MDMGEAVSGPLFAVGLGCRAGADAGAVVALIEAALTQVGGAAFGLFTIEAKAGEPALIEAAEKLAIPLKGLAPADLAAASDRAVTRSDRVIAMFGVPSVAETAALVGAGPGSTLVLPRIQAHGVACAVAKPFETS
jgi:cobalt-precorrin 5A hydrolase